MQKQFLDNTGLTELLDELGQYLKGKLNKLTFDSTPTTGSQNPITSDGIKTALDKKQDTLVSGTNIKTINNTSLLGSGNISVQTPLTFDSIPTTSSTNPVTSGGVATALTSYVTLSTSQNVTGEKTFVGAKKIKFKKSTANDKLGFTLYDNNNKELSYLEYNTGDLCLGSYYSSSSLHVKSRAGFKMSDVSSGVNAVYRILTPYAADAKTPFNLTSTISDFYFPLGVSNGTTTLVTNSTGLLDISSFFNNYYTKTDTDTLLSGKQGTLVSGTDIKTINGNSILGSGDLEIDGDIYYDGAGTGSYSPSTDTINDCIDSLDSRITALGTPNEIASITAVESNVSGGNNVVTITDTDGTTTTFNVKNGVDGVSLGEVALVQTTGDSEESVMSQKAVTEYGRKVTAEDLAGTSDWIKARLMEEGWEFNKYIKTNGDLGNDASCCVSPYLPVSMSEHKGHKLILQYMYYIYSSWCACYYDSNKAYISGLYYQGVSTNTRTVTVGASDSWDNVAYVRYTFGSSKLSECFIYDDNIGEYLFKGDEYISEFCNSLNLTVGSLLQTKGESVSTTMSQKSISDAINYNSNIQFGKCITITDSWNYFKLTPKAVSLLNASERMTFMFSTKGTGFQSDYRYFGFGNGNITSSNGTDTNGACIYWSYNRNCSANYVSYTLNKTSDNKYPTPDVWLVTWDRVNGIVKFYDRTKLINTLEGVSYKKDYFVNDSGAMVIKGGDNTTRVYDIRLFDYDITTLFGNGTFTDEIERLDGAGTPSAFFLNNYTNAREDGSFIAHTNTYGSGTGWTITNNGSTRIYKNSTTTTLLSAGYYIGSDTRARIWKTNIEVVSGVVTFNKGNANWGSIHVYNSNNEEVDRTNVGVGTYTLIGENCSVACWNVFRVSGDVELIETERSYKLMSCVLHMKCDKLYNNKLYDDQTKTFFNFYSDRTFATVKTSNVLSDVPQRKVRTDITALPYYTGDMAISGGKVYIGMPDYTWKQINNS